MTHLDPDQLGGDVRYSVREETSAQVVRNRISVTGGLFVTAMLSAVVLGRRS